MTKLSMSALKATASSLMLAVAIGAAAPAFAQDNPAPAPTPVSAPGMNRPMLQKTELIAPPRGFFCSEREKLDFLLDLFYPAASKATKNNIAAHDYLVKIRRLRDGAPAGPVRDAYQAELDAWEPIWREAEQKATAFLKLLDAIHAMPVIDCTAIGIAALPPGGGVDLRPDPDKAAQLAAAMESKPVVQVGGGSYADFGVGRSRPFDGSEAEHALRDRLKLAAEYRYRREQEPPATSWTGSIPYNPGGGGMTAVEPPTWTGTMTWPPQTGMTSVEPPLPTPVDIDLGGEAGSGDDGLPPPSQPGHLTVDPPSPPVVSSGPAYPPCPTDGMPATPEHIAEFHS